jgi:NAD(P)-dependent dehydrogenase (short-subunit alcohol dehydrogenase family)
MIPLYPDLRDKHVLITGGAGGIGAAITDAFAAQHSRVTILDRDRASGKRLAASHAQQQRNVDFRHVDLTNEKKLIATLKAAQKAHGPVDVLINNAGYDPRYDTTEMTTKQWDDLIRLNLTHYFWTCRELLPAMKQRRRGSIILVSSVNAWSGDERLACYTATKSAALGFMKSLAREVGPFNIRVNAVAPGWIMTPRQARDVATAEDKRRLVEEWQLLPFLLTPEHVAPTFLFFASDASAAITRQVLLVDAGIAMA